MPDHISILDLSNKNIFVGDAIGLKWADGFMLCNPNSPYWEEEDYFRAIEKLKGVEFKTVSLSHFGVISGDEAGEILDDSVSTYRKWMAVFDENSDKIDDVSFLIDKLWEIVYSHITGSYKEKLLPTMADTVRMVSRTYKSRKLYGDR